MSVFRTAANTFVIQQMGAYGTGATLNTVGYVSGGLFSYEHAPKWLEYSRIVQPTQDVARARIVDEDLTPSIGAELAETQSEQTDTATATVQVSGVIAETQSEQTDAITAAVNITGSAAETQSEQIDAGTLQATIAATVAETQSEQIEVIDAFVLIAAFLIETQAEQTDTATGSVQVSGSITETQSEQTDAAQASALILGALAETQAEQLDAASGLVLVGAALAETQAEQFDFAEGTVVDGSIQGTIDESQSSQTEAIAGTVVQPQPPAPPKIPWILGPDFGTVAGGSGGGGAIWGGVGSESSPPRQERVGFWSSEKPSEVVETSGEELWSRQVPGTGPVERHSLGGVTINVFAPTFVMQKPSKRKRKKVPKLPEKQAEPLTAFDMPMALPESQEPAAVGQWSSSEAPPAALAQTTAQEARDERPWRKLRVIAWCALALAAVALGVSLLVAFSKKKPKKRKKKRYGKKSARRT